MKFCIKWCGIIQYKLIYNIVHSNIIFFKKSVIVLYPIFKHTLRKTMKEERKINSCHGALNLTKGRESFLK